MRYIYNAFHTQGRRNSPAYNRHFLCLVVNNMRFRTPVWSVNAPTALVVECNGKGETVLFFANNYTTFICMHSTEKKCLNGNLISHLNTFNGTKSDLTIHQATKLLVKLISSKYPMLKNFRIKKKDNVYLIRAKYGDRRLYACNDSIEEASIHFFHEINQKVILQPYKDRKILQSEKLNLTN